MAGSGLLEPGLIYLSRFSWALVVQLSTSDRDAVRRAFGYAMEAFDMAETSNEEPGDDERSRIDREILDYVDGNRAEVATLVGRGDDELLADPHYLRVAELGFRAILARGHVTVEEMEEDRKRMLAEIENYFLRYHYQEF